ncbi:MAG: DNA translocase FtsK [Candidatus Dependentiae bacterium]|nr:DNA translocase FtsK [Candidatus Dependentiae bacterium]
MKLDILQVMKKYWLTILLMSCSLFVAGSLWSFSPTDRSWLYHATQLQSYKNIFGFFGSHCAVWFIYLFGRAAFISVFVGLYFAWFHFFVSVIKRVQFSTEWDRTAGVLIGFMASAVFCQVYAIPSYDFSYSGGIVGSYLTTHLLASFDGVTQKIIIWMVLLFSVILITRCSYLPMFLYVGKFLQYCFNPQNIPARVVFALYSFVVMGTKFLVFLAVKTIDIFTGSALRKLDSSIVEFEQEENVDKDIEQVVQDLFWHDYIDVEETSQKTVPASKSLDTYDFLQNDKLYEEQFSEEDRSGAMRQKSVFHTMAEKQSKTPSVSLDSEEDKIVTSKKTEKEYELPAIPVKKVEQKAIQEKQDVLAMQARLLEQKLEQFDINGTVVAMHAGPVVTLFEYQPDIKVKVSRILSLEDDLAMALKALSIRIIAPIPGRSVVGFEIANLHRQDVVMAKILQSEEFKKHPGALPIIFGQDTLGNDVIADLAKMPHLLIAGSTGSGKSVALNAILVSLLCSLKPTELKLIIIDPKRLEFAAYDGIAHLLFPIVTDTKKAIPILKWVVQTMEQRYETMAKFGVKNLFDYQMVAQRNKEMDPMPFMVVIIDELADLMMTAGKAVEDSIARIAQMARAAGIHMIIATQRPSVDVITGMIKVNFPNRVAFKVTSKIDSRTILDIGGAEKLLGRGDMLFLDATKSHVVRAHGAYISDQEIHDVVSQIKRQSKVQYLDISEQLNHHDSDELFDGDDELYQEILEFIQELDEVSISMLQRRFRIGYNRSARIISILESKGLIMTVDGGKTRRVVK